MLSYNFSIYRFDDNVFRSFNFSLCFFKNFKFRFRYRNPEIFKSCLYFQFEKRPKEYVISIKNLMEWI